MFSILKGLFGFVTIHLVRRDLTYAWLVPRPRLKIFHGWGLGTVYDPVRNATSTVTHFSSSLKLWNLINMEACWHESFSVYSSPLNYHQVFRLRCEWYWRRRWGNNGAIPWSVVWAAIILFQRYRQKTRVQSIIIPKGIFVQLFQVCVEGAHLNQHLQSRYLPVGVGYLARAYGQAPDPFWYSCLHCKNHAPLRWCVVLSMPQPPNFLRRLSDGMPV